ncbi:MAG TPA: TRAP transporter large permease subunit [Acidobacteriota bacterium]
MKLGAALIRLEDGILVLVLLLATLFPLADAVGRPLAGFTIPGGAAYLQQFMLWLAFVGGLLATRAGKHLGLSTVELFAPRWQHLGRLLSGAIAAATLAVLCYASINLIAVNRLQAKILPGGIPTWVSECIMPVTLALMAGIFAWRASERWLGRLLALAAIPAAFALGLIPDQVQALVWPLGILILAAVLLGAPVFVAMAALALLWFFSDGTPVAAVTAEVYRLISSPVLPAIPLLTGCGYVLAESGASTRLLRFFRALLGWMPGGLAVIVIVISAMFTTFTGGSGVTIIALGGLLYPMLREEGYPEGISLGLVTASASLGLLFPPSVPVVLYSVVAGSRDQIIPADSLYLAGLVPGALMILLVAAFAVYQSRRLETQRHRFALGELGRSLWGAKWELSVPILVIVLFMSGFASMVETAAAALLYAIIIECFLTRDLKIFRSLPLALVKSAVLTGAILILLSAAMGTTSYMVDAQIPALLITWVKTHIHSPLVFLLALNILLLIVGCLVDIYSAIVVLAPLIVPMGVAFGIHPIHQAVIFLANLELGFLTPPVGLNLFLSSARFGKPLTRVYSDTFPFLVIMAISVLLITYLPDLSLGILKLLGTYQAP